MHAGSIRMNISAFRKFYTSMKIFTKVLDQKTRYKGIVNQKKSELELSNFTQLKAIISS